MNWVASNVWLIPLVPLLAAGGIALMPRRAARAAIGMAISAMTAALVMALLAFAPTLAPVGEEVARELNFTWFHAGGDAVRLGFILDPLGAVMLVMVCLVSLMIFVFSAGYMAADANVTRFFGFLSLFAAAMLGLVIANSLLLLFVCWEVMGLASYLLIGFWYERPSAAAAAKKAFIVTRIGDLALFLGMLWLYHASGTLLFFDGGNGCLEGAALNGLATSTVAGGMTVATAVSLLLIGGAVAKSGQVPLHVWLPDAMEGPTPVSALIHAATMVAAGVFLVARAFPLMSGGNADLTSSGGSLPLQVVTWIGAGTAFFAALVATGQTDIKRILAWSTISQLGYMFVGLGTGGIAAGVFHLLTHAFFKSLLFLGAGSVIHGCHGQQDVRWMGGLRRIMPVTFATYAVGMMALAGFPLFFSGFWSKDEILHTAWSWEPSRVPFVLVAAAAVLTAFYMTRQIGEVFFGEYRAERRYGVAEQQPHESPSVMRWPLIVLAVFAVALGFIGTPAWPWFEAWLAGHGAEIDWNRLREAVPMMVVSTALVAAGVTTGWIVYVRRPREDAEDPDPLEAVAPRTFRALHRQLYVDDLYRGTVVALHRGLSILAAWLDRLVIGTLVMATGVLTQALAALARWIDEGVVNTGFDAGCEGARLAARGLSRVQGGRVQRYLGGMVLGMVILSLLLMWGVMTG